MNIFITGISGFIGKKLTESISCDKDFNNICCLCRRDITLPENFTIIKGSLADLDNIPPINADVCIHLAAITNSKTQNNEVFRTNTDGTDSVIKFCKKSGIRKIVFLSSINVHLSEKYEYAQSKIKAEKLIMDSGLDYAILRSSLVYGKGCSSFEKIVKFIKTLHLVPVAGNGSAFEQPIYINEVCKFIIRYTKTYGENEVTDLFGKTKMTYDDMVMKIADIIGENTRLIHLPISPIIKVAEICAKHNIPFPMQPEQIYHMTEDLCGDDEYLFKHADIGLDDFEDNLKKYLPDKG